MIECEFHAMIECALYDELRLALFEKLDGVRFPWGICCTAVDVFVNLLRPTNEAQAIVVSNYLRRCLVLREWVTVGNIGVKRGVGSTWSSFWTATLTASMVSSIKLMGNRMKRAKTLSTESHVFMEGRTGIKMDVVKKMWV